MPLLHSITNLARAADVLRARRYGRIEMQAGRLERVQLRPWPKFGSLAEARLWGRWWHNRQTGDRCWLYYNQPLRASNYLALPYVVSSRDCTLATFHGALLVLDEIARLKRSDAILCDAVNGRISDRLFARWGWEPFGTSGKRQFIKRFYGTYPQPVAVPALVAV